MEEENELKHEGKPEQEVQVLGQLRGICQFAVHGLLALHQHIYHRRGHADVELALGQLNHVLGGSTGRIDLDVNIVLGLVDHGRHGLHGQIG